MNSIQKQCEIYALLLPYRITKRHSYLFTTPQKNHKKHSYLFTTPQKVEILDK